MRSKKHHTKDKGDIAVAKTIADLTEKGYTVFRPVVSEHCHYDLVALDESKQKYYKIQCKYSKDGHARNTTTWTNKNGCKVRKYEEDDFDYYAIYLPDINIVIYPSISFRGCFFRSTIPNSAAHFYWYEDFLDFSDEVKKRNYKDFGLTLSKTMVKNNSSKFRKIERPSKEDFFKLLWEKPSTQIAKDYAVSDKAIEKWAKAYGVPKPPVGYWKKKESERLVIKEKLIKQLLETDYEIAG